MIKFNEVKAATVAANNESDIDRMYNISATVEVKNGVSTNVNSGVVKSLADDREIANFNGWSENSLSINVHGVPEDEQLDVMSAVHVFVKTLKNEAKSLDFSCVG